MFIIANIRCWGVVNLCDVEITVIMKSSYRLHKNEIAVREKEITWFKLFIALRVFLTVKFSGNLIK